MQFRKLRVHVLDGDGLAAAPEAGKVLVLRRRQEIACVGVFGQMRPAGIAPAFVLLAQVPCALGQCAGQRSEACRLGSITGRHNQLIRVFHVGQGCKAIGSVDTFACRVGCVCFTAERIGQCQRYAVKGLRGRDTRGTQMTITENGQALVGRPNGYVCGNGLIGITFGPMTAARSQPFTLGFGPAFIECLVFFQYLGNGVPQRCVFRLGGVPRRVQPEGHQDAERHGEVVGNRAEHPVHDFGVIGFEQFQPG